jgi:hypothetical protein
MVKRNDADIDDLWEKVLVLAQRTDKVEFSLTDAKAQTQNLQTSLELCTRDDAYRKHDWLRAAVTISGALVLIGCLLWFTLMSKVHTLEIDIKTHATSQHVTQEHLQTALDKLREDVKRR